VTSPSLLLGLDVGTQGTKGVVVDADHGKVVARAAVSYGLIEGLPPGAAEQHPQTWIDAVREVARRLFGRGPDAQGLEAQRVAGIGVSGQQHGFVALDENGDVIRPAKLWCDTSTAHEARGLSERIGRHVPTGFTAPKIVWLKEREPEHFARLRWVLLPHDYVNYRLTGRMTMEAGDASGTGLFDPVARAFRRADIEAVDPSVVQMLPDVIGASDMAGRLSAEGADLLGLPEGVPASAGGGDNMMSAIGAGATRPGVVVMSLGTSGTVFTYSDRPVVDPHGIIAPFCDSTGGWLPLLCVMNATGVTEEVRTAFGADVESLTEAASRVERGCEGVLFIPYLQGERVPDLPDATGSLMGLRLGSLRADVLFRAALEGTSLNLGWGVDRMRDLGIPVDAVRLVGGGANNPLWRQILADVIRAPIQVLAETESAVLGAALQALWMVRRQCGDDPTCDEIAQGFVSFRGPPIAPDPANVDFYRHLSHRFRSAVGDGSGTVPPPSPKK